MRGDHRFLSFLRNVRKENQRNAVKIDEKVGENKETQKFKEEIRVCDQAIPILINAIERQRKHTVTERDEVTKRTPSLDSERQRDTDEEITNLSLNAM